MPGQDERPAAASGVRCPMRRGRSHGGRAMTKANILLVDDLPANLLALEAILGGLDLNLVRARSGEEALRLLGAGEFAAVLLDIHMPGMDGFETATLIRSREASGRTPILFVTAHEGDRTW